MQPINLTFMAHKGRHKARPKGLVLRHMPELDMHVTCLVPFGKKAMRGSRKPVQIPLKRYGVIDFSRYSGAALREIRKTHR